MQLEKIKRSERRSSESVLDEKFSLFFAANFKLDNEIDIPVCTISLPVTVTVHVNQEPQAWAPIMWGNANAIDELHINPYTMPEKIIWSKIIQALNIKFVSLTERPLPEFAMKYLAEKIFGSVAIQNTVHRL